MKLTILDYIKARSISYENVEKDVLKFYQAYINWVLAQPEPKPNAEGVELNFRASELLLQIGLINRYFRNPDLFVKRTPEQARGAVGVEAIKALNALNARNDQAVYDAVFAKVEIPFRGFLPVFVGLVVGLALGFIPGITPIAACIAAISSAVFTLLTANIPYILSLNSSPNGPDTIKRWGINLPNPKNFDADFNLLKRKAVIKTSNKLAEAITPNNRIVADIKRDLEIINDERPGTNEAIVITLKAMVLSRYEHVYRTTPKTDEDLDTMGIPTNEVGETDLDLKKLVFPR